VAMNDGGGDDGSVGNDDGGLNLKTTVAVITMVVAIAMAMTMIVALVVAMVTAVVLVRCDDGGDDSDGEG